MKPYDLAGEALCVQYLLNCETWLTFMRCVCVWVALFTTVTERRRAALPVMPMGV